jgi:hypothetical protein
MAWTIVATVSLDCFSLLLTKVHPALCRDYSPIVSIAFAARLKPSPVTKLGFFNNLFFRTFRRFRGLRFPIFPGEGVPYGVFIAIYLFIFLYLDLSEKFPVS